LQAYIIMDTIIIMNLICTLAFVNVKLLMLTS